jgi:hydroxylaminobenzene mutase
LMWHEILLFLLGLVTGLLERRFTNMRMGVSAHLEGVMNGTFFGCAGRYLDRGKALASSQDSGVLDRALWHLCQLVFHHLWRGVRHTAANPIVAAGYHGKPWQETLARAGFLSVAVAIIAASLLVLLGSSSDGPRVTLVEANESILTN